MKKIIVSIVWLFLLMLVAGCSRNTTSISDEDEPVVTGENVLDSELVDTVSQTGIDDAVISTGMSGNDVNTWLVVSTWVFVRRQSEFCKDPTLWWNCDMDDVYFQEKDAEGAVLEFPIGCYSGTLDRIVYKNNGDWTTFNTVAIQFDTEYIVTRNKETIWEQRNMDAPDHRPWGCIIPFASFQILSKWAN